MIWLKQKLLLLLKQDVSLLKQDVLLVENKLGVKIYKVECTEIPCKYSQYLGDLKVFTVSFSTVN